jgi:hypothetical protein
MSRKLEEAQTIAKSKKLNYKTLEISTKKDKRFSIINDHNERIHFGLWPYSLHGTFIDHHDENIRKNWLARHSANIKKDLTENKQGPIYFSNLILW